MVDAPLVGPGQKGGLLEEKVEERALHLNVF